jgi:hypothetical protein
MTKAQTPQVDLGDNLSEAAQALSGDDTPVAPLSAKSTPKKAKPAPEQEEKVRIMLEDNDQIPPGGQFIQVNGRSFMIQPGHEVDVPRCVLDVLDHAVQSYPITDGASTVIGYRDRLRFPYRVITDRRRAA